MFQDANEWTKEMLMFLLGQSNLGIKPLCLCVLVQACWGVHGYKLRVVCACASRSGLAWIKIKGCVCLCMQVRACMGENQGCLRYMNIQKLHVAVYSNVTAVVGVIQLFECSTDEHSHNC